MGIANKMYKRMFTGLIILFLVYAVTSRIAEILLPEYGILIGFFFGTISMIAYMMYQNGDLDKINMRN